MLGATAKKDNDTYYDKSVPDEETHLTYSDFYHISLYQNDDGGFVNDSAMYNANRFEGDIANVELNSLSRRTIPGQSRLAAVLGVQRNAVRQTYLKWVDGRIPYTVSSQYSSYSRAKIAEAIEEYRKKTCIDFSPKSAADQDYIHIVPDDGCYSLVGRIGGKQPVSLGDGCIQKGIIIHELMHAVGFFHEQSRADRDEHVIINWSNVESGLQDQFDKYSLNMIDHLETEYDYGSVMHYAPTAFSKNGKATIEPRKKGVEIGQRIDFSDTDLYKINKLYDCPQVETTARPTEKTVMRARSFGSKLSTPSPSIGASTESTATQSNLSITTGDSSEQSTTISPEAEVPCQDRRSDCEFLARAGHCRSVFSAGFMRDNCSSSCELCDNSSTSKATASKCFDSRSWCERWASSGMCTQAIFQDYMQTKCAKSCRQC
ncbi:hypothetical protein Q1695_000076 [Nippostrongylus brasiliensis]|nr:hypothetical protein Q1695_000076 [Nippostrongylus brasiliensis]